MTNKEHFNLAKEWFIKELEKLDFESGAGYTEQLVKEEGGELEIEYSFSFRRPIDDENTFGKYEG